MSQTTELPRTVGPDGATGGSWRVIVCNDNHNTFDHVATTLARTIPSMTLAQGYEIADRIHTAGLSLVWSGHQELAEHYWQQLDGAGLTMAPLERD